MSGPEFILYRRIIPGTLVFILNHEAYRCARCPAFKYPGQDPDPIGLPALGNVAGFAWFTPIQIVLQIIF